MGNDKIVELAGMSMDELEARKAELKKELKLVEDMQKMRFEMGERSTKQKQTSAKIAAKKKASTSSQV